MATVITKVSLPCDMATLEQAIQRAGHEGHWHDAKVKLGEYGNSLVIYHPGKDE